MFTTNNSIRELKAERAALLAQLNLETKAHDFCPGLDLDEYREMRRRVNRRIDEIERVLPRLESAKKVDRASRKPWNPFRRVWPARA
jgi:hypothetical protein